LINSQEHERGQLFTLGHELAHIFVHKSGICTLDEIHTESSLSKIERFCNQFSAALFVPKSEFEEFAHQKNLRFSNKEQIDSAVDKMQKYFHISIEAAARRLYSLGHASKEYYLEVRKQQIEALDRERQKKGTGGDGSKYYKRVIQWNGLKYTHLVFDSFHENIISLADAAHSLRTDVKHLESIEKELYK
jgi:Zn-dependent peptidase ImmA (M78 family)